VEIQEDAEDQAQASQRDGPNRPFFPFQEFVCPDPPQGENAYHEAGNRERQAAQKIKK
jgi:hypothetical protein